jgi:peptide deformylase
MKKIITTPDPRLRARSAKVREITPEVKQIIADMTESSLDWEQKHPYELSAAMAAPQLGVNQRIIIVRDDLDNKDVNTFTALINPEVIRTEGKTVKDYEGCLSVPEIYGMVARPDKVKIKATLEDGTEVRLKAAGYLARTLQHEIDHLNGILFIDHIRDDDNAFYRMSDKGDLEPITDYENKIKNNPDLWGDE